MTAPSSARKMTITASMLQPPSRMHVTWYSMSHAPNAPNATVRAAAVGWSAFIMRPAASTITSALVKMYSFLSGVSYSRLLVARPRTDDRDAARGFGIVNGKTRRKKFRSEPSSYRHLGATASLRAKWRSSRGCTTRCTTGGAP